jgi:hypothetical protein
MKTLKQGFVAKFAQGSKVVSHNGCWLQLIRSSRHTPDSYLQKQKQFRPADTAAMTLAAEQCSYLESRNGRLPVIDLTAL